MYYNLEIHKCFEILYLVLGLNFNEEKLGMPHTVII